MSVSVFRLLIPASLRFEMAIGLFVCLGFCACAGGRVTLESDPPGAEIYLSRPGQEDGRKVGVTPLTLNTSQLERELGGALPVEIELRKPRYVNSRMLLPEMASGELRVSRKLQPETGFEDLDAINRLTDRLFEAQRLARNSRFEDALKVLYEVSKDAPQLAAVYELQGGIFFVQKKFKESLDAYATAAKLNPKNGSVLQMRNLLETQLGAGPRAVRVPAAGGSP